MPMRFTRALLALALLGVGACDTAPDNEGTQEQPNAAPVTEPGVEAANVPVPPGLDTLRGDTVQR